jgi:hypothetical protein
MLRRALVISLVVLSSAWAEETPKPDIPSSETQLRDFAKGNPDCANFTDLCQTCVRASDQSIKCSTPGFACIRQPWSCARTDQVKN